MKNAVKLVLASGSPRRRQLLANLGIEFEAVALDVNESYDRDMKPEEVSKHIASKKALVGIIKYPDCAVIAADTIVTIDGFILEKPKDKIDAYNMLKKLSGRWHSVLTGVCIKYRGETVLFNEITDVHFKELDDYLIDWYLSTGEPMDKAGSYGIQGYGAMLVDSIEGDYYNVMGLPISRLMDELAKLKVYDVRGI